MLVAKMNCTPVSLGRIVTEEEKESLLEERNHSTLSNSPVKQDESLSIGQKNDQSNNIVTDNLIQPNKEQKFDNELTLVSSENESDSELLLVSDGHMHKISRAPWAYIIKKEAINYYHWFLLLFKNGWWRTTLLLWYIG